MTGRRPHRLVEKGFSRRKEVIQTDLLTRTPFPTPGPSQIARAQTRPPACWLSGNTLYKAAYTHDNACKVPHLRRVRGDMQVCDHLRTSTSGQLYCVAFRASAQTSFMNGYIYGERVISAARTASPSPTHHRK